MRLMRDGDLARQAGTTAKAVRFYESLELLPDISARVQLVPEPRGARSGAE